MRANSPEGEGIATQGELRLIQPKRKAHSESGRTSTEETQSQHEAESRGARQRLWGQPDNVSASFHLWIRVWYQGQLRSHCNHFLPQSLPSQSQGC